MVINKLFIYHSVKYVVNSQKKRGMHIMVIIHVLNHVTAEFRRAHNFRVTD